MTQNLDSTKYGSEESLTKVLDVARFTKVVDNEGNISTVAGECVMACPQTGARAGLQVPSQELTGAVLPRHGGDQGHWQALQGPEGQGDSVLGGR